MLDGSDFGWAEYTVGMYIGWPFSISAEDVAAFARLSGDRSPLHVDSEFARSKGFDAPVVHGLLVAAQLSRLIGVELPDRHAMLIGIAVDFAKPVFAGDPLQFDASLVTKSDATRVLGFKCRVTRDGSVVARGTADAVWRP